MVPNLPLFGINRTQLIVVAFFLLAWLALVAILLLSPDVYALATRQAGGNSLAIEAGFLVALTALIAVLVLGVLRRWRWTFWLVMLAFSLGLLRLPVSALELLGTISGGGPTWYVALQGVTGAVQFLIATAMFVGYRKAGVWGGF